MANLIARGFDSEGPQLFTTALDVPSIVRATDEMTGADINEIFRRIRFDKAMAEVKGAVTQISHDDIMIQIHKFKTLG